MPAAIRMKSFARVRPHVHLQMTVEGHQLWPVIPIEINGGQLDERFAGANHLRRIRGRQPDEQLRRLAPVQSYVIAPAVTIQINGKGGFDGRRETRQEEDTRQRNPETSTQHQAGMKHAVLAVSIA